MIGGTGLMTTSDTHYMAGGPSPFIWGANGQRITPDRVAQNRKVAEALKGRVRDPQNFWQGVQSAVGDIGGSLLDWQAGQQEQRGRDEATAAFSKAVASGDENAMLMATADPWLDPSQTAVGRALWERDMRLQDRDAEWAHADQVRAAGGGDWGTAIQPGVDAAGNLVPLRAAPGGGLSIAPMPDGVRYAPDALVGAKTNATVDAKTAAAARAALPGAQQAREVTDQAMAEIRANADGMREWFGQVGMAPRGMYVQGGTPMAKFVGAAKNASAQAFMQARAMLKGGGQITDYEGRRAEDAYSRMQAAMDSGDQEQYLRAVADFEDAVISGYNKLVAAASGDYSAGGPGITGGYGGTDYKSKYGLE